MRGARATDQRAEGRRDGGFDVAVFFVISGFLVATSWDRAPRVSVFA